MDLFVFQKTMIFMVFIALGLLLKFKFNAKSEQTGIKKIILNLALPATIFIALLGVQIKTEMLLLPILALGLNAILFFGFPSILPFLGIERDSPRFRTAQMLIPSLAPGLSCFPFILEFLGDQYLAKAAMADLGNKVFVLLILYIIAMRWFYKNTQKSTRSNSGKLKDLIINLISEPVNIFIAAALVLVAFGFNLTNLPFIVQESMQRLSLMMTPLVLLFIGIAVNIRKEQFFQILALLSLRAGLVVFLIALSVTFIEFTLSKDILLLVAFSLSACSFWPFAHIAAVEGQEKQIAGIIIKPTFDSGFAIGILALSLPLSVVIILGVLSSGELFTTAENLAYLGLFLCIPGIAYVIYNQLSNVSASAQDTEKTTYGIPAGERS